MAEELCGAPLEGTNATLGSKLCSYTTCRHHSPPLTRCQSVNLRFWMGIHIEATSEEKRAMTLMTQLVNACIWPSCCCRNVMECLWPMTTLQTTKESEKCQAALGRTLLEEFHDGSPSKTLSLVAWTRCHKCSQAWHLCQLITVGVFMCCCFMLFFYHPTCPMALTRNGVSFSSASINYKECQLNITLLDHIGFVLANWIIILLMQNCSMSWHLTPLA